MVGDRMNKEEPTVSVGNNTIEVSMMIDGERKRKRYSGYTKEEAVSAFKEEFMSDLKKAFETAWSVVKENPEAAYDANEYQEKKKEAAYADFAARGTTPIEQNRDSEEGQRQVRANNMGAISTSGYANDGKNIRVLDDYFNPIPQGQYIPLAHRSEGRESTKDRRAKMMRRPPNSGDYAGVSPFNE